MTLEEPKNRVDRFYLSLIRTLSAPVIFFREKIVEPNQQHYPWYHQKYRRVPKIDECYEDDLCCRVEAECQYRRDKLVDDEILGILRKRMEACRFHLGPDRADCKPLAEYYEQAAANWFSKYGDLGFRPKGPQALMRQKHRMIWERRHGPIGSNMKQN